MKGKKVERKEKMKGKNDKGKIQGVFRESHKRKKNMRERKLKRNGR